MSTVRYTAECYPTKHPLFLGGFVAEPQHERCQGRFTIDGVLGGWVCPCPCHRDGTRCTSTAPDQAVS